MEREISLAQNALWLKEETFRIDQLPIGVIKQAYWRPVVDSWLFMNIEPKPYLEMERGTLKTEVENGRGHCGLIFTHCGRYGGIWTWLMDKPDPEKLQKIDDVFARLGTADGDLFKRLVEIGETNRELLLTFSLRSRKTLSASAYLMDA